MAKEISVVLEGPRKISIQEFDIPSPGPKDALLKVEMVGICNGDVGWYKGPRKPPVLPLIMGHEILGRIAEIGSEAQKAWDVSKGDRVVVESIIRCGECRFCMTGNYRFCTRRILYGHHISSNQPPYLWGSYGEYMYLAPGTILHKISEAVPAEAGILVEAIIANGIHWIKLAQTGIGNSVVIQGCEPKALAAVLAAKESGASPIITTGLTSDENGDRFALAKDFGADDTINMEKEDVVNKVRDLTGGRMADIVVDVTGNPKAILKSIELVRPQGTVICAGHVGPGNTTPIITDIITAKEIKFQGGSSNGFEDVTAALKLVESGKHSVQKMVTHKFSLRQAENAFKTAAGELPGSRPVKVALTP